MNWNTIEAQVLAITGSDEFKAFLLGALLAVGARLIRMGVSWLKRIDSDVVG